jgi:hypothetical protein
MFWTIAVVRDIWNQMGKVLSVSTSTTGGVTNWPRAGLPDHRIAAASHRGKVPVVGRVFTRAFREPIVGLQLGGH